MNFNNEKVLIIVASNSSSSINKTVAKQLQQLINCDLIGASYYDAIMYSFDQQQIEFPHIINEFMEKLRSYDTLIFFTPEHNGYLPAFFKNIMDWSSRGKYGMDFLSGKKAIIVCVTPGQMGGISVRLNFTTSLGFTGAKVIGSVGIANYQLKLDVSEKLNEIVTLINKQI